MAKKELKAESSEWSDLNNDRDARRDEMSWAHSKHNGDTP